MVGEAPEVTTTKTPSIAPEAALILEDNSPLLSLPHLPPKLGTHLHDEGHCGPSLDLLITWCHIPEALCLSGGPVPTSPSMRALSPVALGAEG